MQGGRQESLLLMFIVAYSIGLPLLSLVQCLYRVPSMSFQVEIMRTPKVRNAIFYIKYQGVKNKK